MLADMSDICRGMIYRDRSKFNCHGNKHVMKSSGRSLVDYGQSCDFLKRFPKIKKVIWYQDSRKIWVIWNLIDLPLTTREEKLFINERVTLHPLFHSSSFSRGCRIYLCSQRQRVSWYDIKESDGEAPALQLWGMLSTPFIAIAPRSA